MVELSSPQSRIRDVAPIPRHIPIEVDGTGTYEILLTMWTAFETEQTPTGFDLGPVWLADIQKMTPNDLRDEMTSLGGPHIWPSLLGLISSAPHPHDPDRVLDWLAAINPQRLRLWMLSYIGINTDSGLIEEAADGDLNAVRRIVLEGHDDQDLVTQLVSVFEIPAPELRDRLVGAIKRFRTEVYARFELDTTAAIERAAAAQRATSTQEGVNAVIEEVTNGLDYEVPPGVSRVVLVPSVVLRPLSVVDQHRDTLVVLYGMADEFIDSDPEAPPSWLVKTFKALGDDRRLRILRRLSGAESSLDDLVELTALSKSTVHHHMSVLRAAGLVTVRVKRGQKETKETQAYAESQTYALRHRSLANACAFLESYLRTDHQPVSNRSET